MLHAVALACLGFFGSDPLVSGFENPPPAARTRAYWWWLNGNVDRAAIHRDLKEMAAKGFGGAILADAGGADQRDNAQVPHGPDFGSPEWRKLFKYTLEEAERYGLEISLNIQSGWNLGGPTVPAADAPKKLVWSETVVAGGATSIRLPEPKHPEALYQPVAVVAYPVAPDYQADKRATLTDWQQKALLSPLHFSAPTTGHLLADSPDQPGEAATRAPQVLDLTSRLRPDGTLDWTAPAGRWEILRIGATLNDHCMVSTHSEGGGGYALDPFDAGAFNRYWNRVIGPMLAEVKPHLGKGLRYLHTDSWEVEVANWTPTLFTEFQKRRGYDLRPYLPVLAGRIVGSRSESDRVLNDLRRTMGDLAIANHYRLFRDYAHRVGLQIHPESGGPHAVPIDSLQCLGYNDAPMSEFWASAKTHRVKDEDRFFVKQPASAAHTYGRNLVLAEGFTTIGPHWQETIWDNLRPNFDRAITEGLNRLVWHEFVCSPASEGLPGQQYFAGTHFNPNVTWWEQSSPFLTYLNRVQFLMQQGRPVADVLVYYGDHVPNFTQLRASDPGGVGSGYDYDVATAEVLLTRLRVRNRRLVRPDGGEYRVLVMPPLPSVSLPVLKKVAEFARAGVPVIGNDFAADSSWKGRGTTDLLLRKLAATLLKRQPAGEYLATHGSAPDCDAAQPVRWIHRTVGDREVYFVANPEGSAQKLTVKFRPQQGIPQLWDAISGQRYAAAYRRTANGTEVDIPFTPYGSWAVVFSPRNESLPSLPIVAGEVATLNGPWQVAFDARWGGPATTTFPTLIDWTTSSDPGVRFYSGTATYRTTFTAPATSSPLYLDLGNIRELAEVRLNGRSLGITWAPPFRVRLDGLREGLNQLEVRVTNFWPNRIIGDAVEGTHFTRTNIRQLTAKTPLMPAGLLGPVRIVR